VGDKKSKFRTMVGGDLSSQTLRGFHRSGYSNRGKRREDTSLYCEKQDLYKKGERVNGDNDTPKSGGQGPFQHRRLGVT